MMCPSLIFLSFIDLYASCVHIAIPRTFTCQPKKKTAKSVPQPEEGEDQQTGATKCIIQCWSKEMQLWIKNFSWPPLRREVNFEHSPIYSRQFQSCLPFLEEISALLLEKSWIEWRYMWKQKLHFPQNSIRNSVGGAPLANYMLKTQVNSNIAHQPSTDTITGTFCRRYFTHKL